MKNTMNDIYFEKKNMPKNINSFNLCYVYKLL